MNETHLKKRWADSRNRSKVKTAWLIQHEALFAKIRPFKTDLAYDLLAAIHKAATLGRVFEALNLFFASSS